MSNTENKAENIKDTVKDAEVKTKSFFKRHYKVIAGVAVAAVAVAGTLYYISKTGDNVVDAVVDAIE